MAASNEGSLTKCDGCSEHTSVAICGYCKTCESSLCGSCFDYHLNAGFLKSHYLIRYDSCTSGPEVSRDITDEKCSSHPGENVLFYCKMHQCTFCSICKEDAHKNCRRKNLSKTWNSKKIAGFEENLQNINELLDMADCFVNESENTCKTNITKFYYDMGLLRKQIIEKIDSLFKLMGADVEHKHEKTLKSLNDVSNLCEAKRQNIHEQLNKLKDFSRAHQCGRIYVLRKTNEPLIEKMKLSIEESLATIDVKLYSFSPNRSLLQTHVENQNSLGSIHELKNENDTQRLTWHQKKIRTIYSNGRKHINTEANEEVTGPCISRSSSCPVDVRSPVLGFENVLSVGHEVSELKSKSVSQLEAEVAASSEWSSSVIRSSVTTLKKYDAGSDLDKTPYKVVSLDNK